MDDLRGCVRSFLFKAQEVRFNFFQVIAIFGHELLEGMLVVHRLHFVILKGIA
jgi:hypothetical protein